MIVRRIDRGGDVTYHGAGQIVGYPIIALDRDSLRRDVVGYVRRLERLLLRALADYGIAGAVIPGLTGVWVDDAKIAAIGVRVTAQAVTKHGFALNVDPDLTYFEGIIPCGIRDKAVTSMARVLGTAPDTAAVIESLIRAYAEVFEAAIVRA